MTLPLTKNPSTLHKFAVIFWFAILSVLAGIVAYYRMFTGFNSYDDEGSLMVTVKQFLGGAKLYNHTLNPYGPVYYFYNWALRTLSGTPVTHNVVRMSSLIPWLLTALVSAWIVLRLTDSLVLASFTHLLTCSALSAFFHNEPGHPQELSILLLVCLVASGTVTLIPGWRMWGIALVGALTAALFLVKVNIGTFAFLGSSLAILAHSPKTKLSRLAFTTVAAASLLLPIVMIGSHLRNETTLIYAVLVVTSMIAALLILFRVPRTSCFRWRDSWLAIGSFAFTFLSVILILRADGSGLNATLHALVLDSFTKYMNLGDWFAALPAEPGWLPWIVIGLAAAIYFSRDIAEKGQIKDGLLYFKLAVSVVTVIALYYGTPPYRLVLPFCWLVLYDHSEDAGASNAFPRTILCTVTVLQTLYTYPAPGSQMGFIQVLPIIVAMTLLGDLLRWQQQKLSTIPPVLVRAATTMLLLWVAGSYLVIARSERKFYDSLPALQLRGAGRIHLYPAQARDYPWLVQNLNEHCDIFMGFPEVPSLHIWTGKDPLAGLEFDDWILIVSDRQQIAASAVLSQHPNACAIYNPDLVAFWNRTHQNWDSIPLVRYLHENFKVVGATGQFYFLVRNERNLNIASPVLKIPFNPATVNELWKSNGCLGLGCSH
jgi:hypothetical protein